MVRRIGGIAVLTVVAGLGQSGTKLPEFEVASIRPAELNGLKAVAGALDARIPSLGDVQPGRQLTVANQPLKGLIMLAYGVGAGQISAPGWQGDPEWSDNHFDILAKVPVDATKAQLPLMMQALLADRFKLALHREMRDTTVFALTVARGGAKVHETAADDRHPAGCDRSWGTTSADLVADCHGLTAAGMAQALETLAPSYFDRPLVDATGLSGVYSFSVEWIMRSAANAGVYGATIFEAVQKIGLKIETRKEPVEFLVVDRCEKMPTAN